LPSILQLLAALFTFLLQFLPDAPDLDPGDNHKQKKFAAG
jgi:hypothetical protein